MIRTTYLSRKLNIPIFSGKYRKFVIGAIVAIATVVLFLLIKDTVFNKDTKDNTSVYTDNSIVGDTDWLEKNLENERIVSNEQIIYIAPKDLYSDDKVVISVTSHVDNQLYGQGLRFEYRNKSLDEIEIEVMPVGASKTLDSNKIIVEPGTTKTQVLYIGLDSEPFTEGRYIFTITVGDSSYVTETITIKAK